MATDGFPWYKIDDCGREHITHHHPKYHEYLAIRDSQPFGCGNTLFNSEIIRKLEKCIEELKETQLNPFPKSYYDLPPHDITGFECDYCGAIIETDNKHEFGYYMNNIKHMEDCIIVKLIKILEKLKNE